MPTGIYQRTEFHRQLCSKASRGIKRTDEFKKKVSDGMKKLLSSNQELLSKRIEHLDKIRFDKDIQLRRSKSLSITTEKQWKENKEYRKLMLERLSNIPSCEHPAWQGGKSFEPYSPSFNKQLKSKIRVRDNFKCRLCGVPEIECYEHLHIHHIDYNKKNCKEDNLISLCRRCHVGTNFRRKDWEKAFNQMLYAGEGPRSFKTEIAL